MIFEGMCNVVMNLINYNDRSWVEISLPNIKNNYLIYKYCLPEHISVMAVVKADAYGHGDQVISKYLAELGVNDFAVSNIDEAIHIRQAGVKGQILILGYTPINRVKELIDYNITQAILSEEYAELLIKSRLPITCQFAIDTGMRRIGLNSNNLTQCEKAIRQYANKLKLNGIFTHLCVADSADENDFTNAQIQSFELLKNRLHDLNLSYCHCLNSAGGLWHSNSSSCFARLGIILYGLKPDYSNVIPEGIKPALSWKSVISMVKTVNAGDTIGYGRSYKVSSTMTIATISTGYADGYNRLLSNKGWVLINGQKAFIVGRICMDQLMVDVTEIRDANVGTEVVLIGISGEETITVDDVANVYGTIGYEVVCGINKRVTRRYIYE